MPYLVIVIALIVVGSGIVTVNIFTIFTITLSNKLRTPAYFPIISFLAAALIQGFVVVPSYIAKRWNDPEHPKWICALFRFPYFLCGHLQTLSLMAVSIDRILAITYPLHYSTIITRTKMLVGLLLMWTGVISADIMPFVPRDDAMKSCPYRPWKEWSLSVIIISIIIPFVVICICYIRIWFIALQHARKLLRTNTIAPSPSRPQQNTTSWPLLSAVELKATKTSALIIGVYLACWGPIGIYYMITNVCYSCIYGPDGDNIKSNIGFAVKIISFVSSILSPVAYCWRNTEFKEEFRRKFYRRKWRAANHALQPVSSEREVTRGISFKNAGGNFDTKL